MSSQTGAPPESLARGIEIGASPNVPSATLAVQQAARDQNPTSSSRISYPRQSFRVTLPTFFVTIFSHSVRVELKRRVSRSLVPKHHSAQSISFNMPMAVGPVSAPAELEVPVPKGADADLSLAGLPGSLPTTLDTEALNAASKILHVIDRYRLRKTPGAPVRADEGALKFLAVIYSHVRAGEAVPMCLPAFPFKSPNSSTKVLGKLPDRAEELALAHLNGLCLAIGDIYPPGAKLTIISDGLVYNGKPTLSASLY